ncbi:hypothetical protein [Amycolatopsis sp. NPDC003861]
MNNWLVLIGTLFGTVIGTTGTIASQHLASRAAERRERAARAAGYRAERLHVSEAMIEVGQAIERAAVNRREPSSELHDRLWILQARLAIVASDRLKQTMNEWVIALNRVHWEGAPADQPVWAYLQEPRGRFLDAVSAELAGLES